MTEVVRSATRASGGAAGGAIAHTGAAVAGRIAFVMGLFSDRFGRRPAMLLAALLAGVFVWPFAFVSNFWGLVVLSVLSTLGVGAIVATHAVYISEIVSPEVRNRVMLGSQGITALITVISGLLAFWLIPSHWQWYVYLMAAFQLLVLFPLLAWRLPESPRWLEARGRQAEAERAVETLEQRCQRYVREPFPEPDPRPHPVVQAGRGAWRELFTSPVYRPRTLVTLAAWFLGYAGIVYGAPSFAAPGAFGMRAHRVHSAPRGRRNAALGWSYSRTPTEDKRSDVARCRQRRWSGTVPSGRPAGSAGARTTTRA